MNEQNTEMKPTPDIPLGILPMNPPCPNCQGRAGLTNCLHCAGFGFLKTPTPPPEQTAEGTAGPYSNDPAKATIYWKEKFEIVHGEAAQLREEVERLKAETKGADILLQHADEGIASIRATNATLEASCAEKDAALRRLKPLPPLEPHEPKCGCCGCEAIRALANTSGKALLDRLSRAEAALREIALKQPAVLDIIQRNGFVFTDMGREPGNWQHLAFTIYTSLCEVDQTARAAIDAAQAAAGHEGEG
jgi:hypothetical protein